VPGSSGRFDPAMSPYLDLDLPATGGTYAVVLHLDVETEIAVGALGSRRFAQGLYLYVGSAWGPGGLSARVRRHLTRSRTLRWHIDYLAQHTCPAGVWLAPGARVECDWAAWLTEQTSARVIVPRFGASDCACTAHLFHLGNRLEVDFPFPHDILFVPGSLAQSGRAGAF
jgi:Uri superfamily endonuclease